MDKPRKPAKPDVDRPVPMPEESPDINPTNPDRDKDYDKPIPMYPEDDRPMRRIFPTDPDSGLDE